MKPWEIAYAAAIIVFCLGKVIEICWILSDRKEAKVAEKDGDK